MRALILLFTGLALGLLLLKQQGRRWPSPSLLLAAVPLGLLVCAVATAGAWYLGIAPKLSIPTIVVVVLLLFAADLWSSRKIDRPIGEISFAWQWAHLASLGIIAFYLFPTLYALAWMGTGESPPVFFGGDTPVYLSHVHALAQADRYPPLSLNTAGVAAAYHYAVQFCAALLTRLGGVPAHRALFWIVAPLLLLGKVAVVWRLADLGKSRGVPHWLSVLCLLFFVVYLLHLLNPPNPTKLFRVSFSHFSTGMLMFSGMAGCYLVYLVALLMIDERFTRRATAITSSVGILPLVKSVYLVPVGIWVGSWGLSALFFQRLKMPLIVAALSALLAFALSRIGVREGFEFAVSLDIGSRPQSILRSATYNGALIGTALAVLLLVWRSVTDTRLRNLALLFLAASALIVCLPLFVVVTYRGAPESNIEQWFIPVMWISSVSVALSLSAGWSAAYPVRKIVIGVILATYLSLPILAKANETFVLLYRTADWHEFVDNAPLAPALAAIPLKNSLIATNDLHYPANNYSRDRFQPQISSLFGHHVYGAFYAEAPDGDERVARQKLLQQANWTYELTRTACDSGWTHVLLSKRVPYVKDVPGTRLYESDAFAVYQLPACDQLP